MNERYVDRLSRTDRDVILTLVPEGVTVLEPAKLREMVIGVAKGAIGNYAGENAGGIIG